MIGIFEQARAFFDENSRFPTVSEEPIHIIAFQSEREFRPYSSNAGAIAYYQRARYDFIVMRDLTAASYPIAIHEYTHLYLAHRGFKLPVWLNEGLADVYSTLQALGSGLIIGAPVPIAWLNSAAAGLSWTFTSSQPSIGTRPTPTGLT